MTFGPAECTGLPQRSGECAGPGGTELVEGDGEGAVDGEGVAAGGAEVADGDAEGAGHRLQRALVAGADGDQAPGGRLREQVDERVVRAVDGHADAVPQRGLGKRLG